MKWNECSDKVRSKTDSEPAYGSLKHIIVVIIIMLLLLQTAGVQRRKFDLLAQNWGYVPLRLWL